MHGYGAYVYTFNNSVKFVDPDGRGPTDWFKETGGRVVWFDSKSKGYTDNTGGKWSNVGATTAQVQQTLNIPMQLQSLTDRVIWKVEVLMVQDMLPLIGHQIQ